MVLISHSLPTSEGDRIFTRLLTIQISSSGKLLLPVGLLFHYIVFLHWFVILCVVWVSPLPVTCITKSPVLWFLWVLGLWVFSVCLNACLQTLLLWFMYTYFLCKVLVMISNVWWGVGGFPHRRRFSDASWVSRIFSQRWHQIPQAKGSLPRDRPPLQTTIISPGCHLCFRMTGYKPEAPTTPPWVWSVC